MRSKLNAVVGLDFLFLILLLGSSLCAGTVSAIVFYAAYLVPILIGLGALTVKKRFDGIALLPKKKPADRLLSILPLGAPTLLSVVLLSMLTGSVLGLFGKSNVTVLPDSTAEALLVDALLPAVLEELLFRFLPLRILAGEDKKSAVFYSALLFAAMHCSLFQMPYAFAAGVLFAALDLAAGSLLPSLALHLFNNVAGVFAIKSASFVYWYLGALVLLTAVSLVFLFKRKSLRARFSWLFDKKRKLFLSGEPFILLLFTLYIAVSLLL